MLHSMIFFSIGRGFVQETSLPEGFGLKLVSCKIGRILLEASAQRHLAQGRGHVRGYRAHKKPRGGIRPFHQKLTCLRAKNVRALRGANLGTSPLNLEVPKHL